MIASIIRTRVRVALRQSSLGADQRVLVLGLAISAGLALFVFAWVVSSIGFAQMQTLYPGPPSAWLLSLVFGAGWVAAVLAAAPSSYDLMMRQRDYLYLSVSPVPALAVFAVRLAETWVRVGAIITLGLVATGLGWASVSGSNMAWVLLFVVVCAVLITTSGCAVGAGLTLLLVAGIGRRRFEELIGAAPIILITAAVSLQGPAQSDPLAANAPTAELLARVGSTLASLHALIPPTAWVADGLLAVREGDVLEMFASSLALAIGAGVLIGIVALCFRTFYASVVFAESTWTRVRRRALPHLAARAMTSLGAVGAIALVQLRSAWRDAEQRLQLLMMPIVLPVYAVKLPQMLGFTAGAASLETLPAVGLMFGLLAGYGASSKMALMALAPEGPESWLVATAPVTPRGVLLGRYLGACLRCVSVVVPVTLVGGLAVGAALDAVLVHVLVGTCASGAIIAGGLLVGAVLPPTGGAAEAAGRPRLAAALTYGVAAVSLSTLALWAVGAGSVPQAVAGSLVLLTLLLAAADLARGSGRR